MISCSLNMKVVILLSIIVVITCSYCTSKERLEFLQPTPPGDVSFLLISNIEMNIERYGHLILEEIIETRSDHQYFLVSELLKSPRVKVEKINTTYLLNTAVSLGHSKVLKVLLNDSRFTPTNSTLNIAVQNNEYDIVLILMEDGRFRPDSDTILSCNNFGILKLLLSDVHVTITPEDVQTIVSKLNIEQRKEIEPVLIHKTPLYKEMKTMEIELNKLRDQINGAGSQISKF